MDASRYIQDWCEAADSGGARRYRTVFASRASTVDSSLGAAAAIRASCAPSGFGVRRHYQQGDCAVVETDDLDGADRLTSMSVEPYRSPAGKEFRGWFRPFVDVEQHTINGSEPNRQHCQQIWELRVEVVAARPPCPVDESTPRSFGLQSQSRRVFRRRALRRGRRQEIVVASLRRSCLDREPARCCESPTTQP